MLERIRGVPFLDAIPFWARYLFGLSTFSGCDTFLGTGVSGVRYCFRCNTVLFQVQCRFVSGIVALGAPNLWRSGLGFAVRACFCSLILSTIPAASS